MTASFIHKPPFMFQTTAELPKMFYSDSGKWVIIWNSLFSICHMLRSLAHKSSSEKVTVGNVLSVCGEERGGLFCFARMHPFFLTKRLALWHPSCDQAVGGKGAWSVPPGAGRQGSRTLIASPRNCVVKIWVTSISHSWKCSQPCFMKLSNKMWCLLQLLILCKIYLIWANGYNKTRRVGFFFVFFCVWGKNTLVEHICSSPF